MTDSYNLITRNLQEILGDDDLKKILLERPLSIYWGTATTGQPHIAYFLPILKIYDFLQAGCKIKILLADIHAFLDNMKAPIDMIEKRAIYYEKIIKAMLKSLGIYEFPNIKLDDFNKSENIKTNDFKTNEFNDANLHKNIKSNNKNFNENSDLVNVNLNNSKINLDDQKKINNLIFVKGSDYQLSKEYTMDLYKLSTFTTEHDAKKAGAQVVKQVKNPLLSSLIYPSMQALDEEYLKVDAQFGGVDQRKIFTYAMKHLPMLGYKKRIHLMNPMIPGLNSDKMSSSDEFSKIDLLDDEKTIKKKIRKCFCEEGNKENGIMYLMKFIVFPIYEIKKIKVEIKRRDLESLFFENYFEFEKSFVNKEIHPADLKENVGEFVENIVKPVREEMNKDKEIIENAYCQKKNFKK
ncbi:hypothetical protein GVAV_001183 [Gurleya vavrai]